MLAGLPPGTRFLDSQPLTGVIADRHLNSAEVTFPELAARNRAALTWSHPTDSRRAWPLNPRLAIAAYSDLAPWLSGYERIAETKATVLYRRRP